MVFLLFMGLIHFLVGELRCMLLLSRIGMVVDIMKGENCFEYSKENIMYKEW